MSSEQASTVRVDVARGALMDVGRPDLADLIRCNRIGNPSCCGGIYVEGRPLVDSEMIVTAMRLGHLADPEGPPVVCLRETDAVNVFPACRGCRGECDQ